MYDLDMWISSQTVRIYKNTSAYCFWGGTTQFNLRNKMDETADVYMTCTVASPHF